MSTQTTNLGLNKPAEGDTDWAGEVNGNWDTLDAVPDSMPMPIFWTMMSSEPDSVGQGSWTPSREPGSLLYGYFYNTTDEDGDNFSCKFRCPKGTYKLRINATKDMDAGILKLYIDDEQVGESGGYDQYNASYDGVHTIDISGLELDAGEHTLKFEVDGTNPSSGEYYMYIIAVTIQRTA